MSARTMVLYGKSGVFKTANMGFLAMYIYEKYKKVSRYVYSDGGSWAHLQPLVEIGILEPFVLVDDPYPMAVIKGIVMDKLWPAELSADFKRTSGKTTREMNHVGAYIFEGVTSMSELLQSKYRGIKTGMSPAYSESVKAVLEGGQNHMVGSLSMDSYGIIQGEMMEIITRSWQLPVELVCWTGHEAQAEDEQTRKVMRGLALVGNATTSRMGKRIGTMIHAQQVQKDPKSLEMETRYYYQSHADPLFPQIPWEAKSRVPAAEVPRLLKMKGFEGGFFTPSYEHGLDDYLRAEDSLMEANVGRLEEWKKKTDQNRK